MACSGQQMHLRLGFTESHNYLQRISVMAMHFGTACGTKSISYDDGMEHGQRPSGCLACYASLRCTQWPPLRP